jgi:hypothetical protein
MLWLSARSTRIEVASPAEMLRAAANYLMSSSTSSRIFRVVLIAVSRQRSASLGQFDAFGEMFFSIAATQ